MGDIDATALETLAQGLRLAGAPLCELGQPLAYLAHALEDGDAAGDGLAVLSMSRTLRLMSAHPDCPDLIDRLEALDGAPWPQIRAALEAAAELSPETAHERTPAR